jgi:uncharacterized membrane protein YebE (DUF533 family)
MAEPITIAGVVIGGLVSAYKAYTEYKAATTKAAEAKAPAPAKSEAAVKGEQAAPIIKAGVEQHGEPKDVKVVANFEDDPETYEEALQKMLARLAASSQPFAQQLQTLAQQADIQTGGVQGSVNVSGQGKVIGPSAGVNTGTMGGTFNVGGDDDK